MTALAAAQASDTPGADRLQDDHRLRRAETRGHREMRMAKRWAPKRSPARAQSSAGRTQPFEIPDESARPHGARVGARGAHERKAWEARLPADANMRDAFETAHVGGDSRRARHRLLRR